MVSNQTHASGFKTIGWTPPMYGWFSQKYATKYGHCTHMDEKGNR